MAQGSFSAQVSAWVKETKERQTAVYKESAQRVIGIMQEPGPSRASVAQAISMGQSLGRTKKSGSKGVSKRTYGPVSVGGGGNIPVDTGFLRASLDVSIGTDLPPIVDAPDSQSAATWDPGEVTLALAAADIKDPITAVYTAAYARRIHWGFSGQDSAGRTYSQRGNPWVTLAAQRWPQVVNEVCTEAKSRAGG